MSGAPPAGGSPTAPPAPSHSWTVKVREAAVEALPPETVLPDGQPIRPPPESLRMASLPKIITARPDSPSDGGRAVLRTATGSGHRQTAPTTGDW